MTTDRDGWVAQHGVLVSSRRKPNETVRRLRMPAVVRRHGIDPVEVAIAAILISGLVASVLLGLAAVFGAAWLAVTAVRELLRALAGG